jgi:ribosomal protein S18 acetylase RimI-like enzyme
MGQIRISDNAPEPVIRFARPDDAAAIRAVQAETWIATYPNEELGITRDGLRQHLEGAHGEKIAAGVARIRKHIESEASGSAGFQHFVAVFDGEIVGYTSPFVEPDGRRRLGALYVLPSAQGLGIGHLLLERNLAWHGADQAVYLNVAAYNEQAKRFYERHGFVLTGEQGHDELAMIGAVVIPELEMVRRARQRPGTSV